MFMLTILVIGAVLAYALIKVLQHVEERASDVEKNYEVELEDADFNMEPVKEEPVKEEPVKEAEPAKEEAPKKRGRKKK